MKDGSEAKSRAVWEGESWCVWLERETPAGGQRQIENEHLTRSKSQNFYLMRKTIGSHCGKSEKRSDGVKIKLR